MLKTVLNQTAWNIIGTIFGFGVGFFVKMFLVNKVGASDFGLYIIATQFETAIGTLLALGVPTILLKFVPQNIKNKTFDENTTFISKFLIYTLALGFIGGILTILLSSLIAVYLFNNTDLSIFLMIAGFYIPLSMYSTYITSVYRSLIKIKEIILYGTFYLVSIRAILTFIIFSFFDNILYFMYIELFSLIIVITLLTLKLKTDKFKLFDIRFIKEKVVNDEILSYGKKIYLLSLISFFSGYILMFIMSINLEPKEIGIYAILTTIAGLTSFLLINVNRVFAPIISTLYANKDFKNLESVYRDSTFLINLVTIPFILSVLYFAKDILGLYGAEFSKYSLELLILFIGNFFVISVGSSGTIMVMAGLEKVSLYLQIFKLVGVTILSIYFLPKYGLMAGIIIYSLSTFIINMLEVYYIKKRINIFPLNFYTYLLFVFLIIGIYFIYDEMFINHTLIEYLLIPIITYLIFFLFFIKKTIMIIKEVREAKE